MRRLLLFTLVCAAFGVVPVPLLQAGPPVRVQTARGYCAPVYRQPVYVPRTYYYGQSAVRVYTAPVVVAPGTVYYYPGYTRPYQLYSNGYIVR